ncbi:MAG: hypothetical protein ACI8PZ_001962 [Myxococcota bacterium]|jgi:hypothetical protein
MPGRDLLDSIPRPTVLPTRRGPNRGDGQTVSLSALPASERVRVRTLYAFLVDLQHKLDPCADDPAAAFAAVAALDEATVGAVFDTAQSLGVDLQGATGEVRKAMHDVRGGSLTALLTHVDLIHDGIAGPVDAERVHLLVRDHLKMMRNALFDLDPDRYTADLVDREHGMDLLRAKWTRTTWPVAGRQARVHLDSDFAGSVSERCMEFSSLDRVLYNLVNNAGRFAADGQVTLIADAVDAARDTHLRFAVINPVGPDQSAALRARFGGDLSTVFEGGFTTGGHGLGTRICADLVRHAYGLVSVQKALTQHILGAELVADHYVAWFHWPAMRAG